MEAGLPLRLQLTGSASGNPDLRLQLLSVKAGTACERVQHHQAPNQHNAVVAGVLCSSTPNIAHGHSWQQQHQQIRSCKYPYFSAQHGQASTAMECVLCMHRLMLYTTLPLCTVGTVSGSFNYHIWPFLGSYVGELFHPRKHDTLPLPPGSQRCRTPNTSSVSGPA